MKAQFNRYRPTTTRNAVENRSRTAGIMQQVNASKKKSPANQSRIPHQPPNQNKTGAENTGPKLI